MESSLETVEIMSGDDGNRLKGEIFSLRGGLASFPERIFFSPEKNHIIPGDDCWCDEVYTRKSLPSFT